MRLALILAVAGTLHSQEPPSRAQIDAQRRAAQPGMYALTELARSAPPEFAARAILHILDANGIDDRAWALDLANEALAFAGHARHPIRKRLAPGFTAADSRAMLWHVAYSQGLDALSLSMRAIDHLRRLDPAAARKAFIQYPRPNASTASCKDALLDDSSPWYTEAGRVNADPGTILNAIQSARTHAEIAPAIELIFNRRGTPQELDLYAGAIGEKLRSLPASEREFAAALFATPKKIAFLFSTLARFDRPTGALADGWRAWMQTGLEVPACQESRNAGPFETARREALELFNATVEPGLDSTLLKPKGTGEAAQIEPFAENEGTRRQATLLKQLLFGDASRGLSNAEKSTPEWRENMQKYVQSIEGRTRSSDESDVEYFYRQSQSWAGVLMASPAGPDRDRALQQYISFLLANAPHIDPLIWFSQVESMADLTRSLHGEDFDKVLSALYLTGHPVLRLYAELEAAIPSRPTSKPD